MVLYFDVKHAIEVHDNIIKRSGGRMGMKDDGDLLKSVLGHMQNDDYYPEFLDKISYLVFGINKNHSFIDGNKRSSIALSSYFLELNGHDFAVNQYTHGMEEVAVWLASSLIDRDQLKDIIEFLLYDDNVRIAYFIEECKKFRSVIENNLISRELLGKMIICLLSDEMAYSEEVHLELLNALTANT